MGNIIVHRDRQSHTHTHRQIHTQTHTHRQIHTQTHTQADTHTHTHTHTYRHLPETEHGKDEDEIEQKHVGVDVPDGGPVTL